MIYSPQVNIWNILWSIEGYLKQNPYVLKRARTNTDNETESPSKTINTISLNEYSEMRRKFMSIINDPWIPLRSIPFLFAEYM